MRPGLSEVLGDQLRLEDAIVRLDPAGLHLLPGGNRETTLPSCFPVPPTSVCWRKRRMFDYIIIDAPPLGIFTDANVLMSRADGAMLVVRAGKTRYSVVDKLLEQIPREKLLGVVLNRAEISLIQPITTISIATAIARIRLTVRRTRN